VKFKSYLKKLEKDISEETTSADIATVDNKLDMVKRYEKKGKKGKKCKAHGRVNCEECSAELSESKWN